MINKGGSNNLIGVVDYGIAGNIHSVKNAIKKAGGSVIIISNPSDFDLVSKIIIPGVGSFSQAMDELKNDNFIDSLKTFDRPILGICLGMQILSKFGFENGRRKGLDLIDAEVKLIQCNEKIPHLGFNKIEDINSSVLFDGIKDLEFYFMHSYAVDNCNDVTSKVKYGGSYITASIQKDNIFGVQFHPEKSRGQGIKLLKNFINLQSI